MYKMKRTPDIRVFQPEHLLDISDLMKYLKNGFRVEPQTVVINEVEVEKEVKLIQVEEEKEVKFDDEF